MLSITALLHTENDELRLGRCLETLHACEEILIIDHASRDRTVRIAHEYGATVLRAVAGASPDFYLRSARAGWFFCLDPRESLTENLAASLFEWKSLPLSSGPGFAFSVFLREETAEGWVEIPSPQTRLIPHNWNRWEGKFPANDPSAIALEGELLRFALP